MLVSTRATGVHTMCLNTHCFVKMHTASLFGIRSSHPTLCAECTGGRAWSINQDRGTEHPLFTSPHSLSLCETDPPCLCVLAVQEGEGATPQQVLSAVKEVQSEALRRVVLETVSVIGTLEGSRERQRSCSLRPCRVWCLKQ